MWGVMKIFSPLTVMLIIYCWIYSKWKTTNHNLNSWWVLCTGFGVKIIYHLFFMINIKLLMWLFLTQRDLTGPIIQHSLLPWCHDGTTNIYLIKWSERLKNEIILKFSNLWSCFKIPFSTSCHFSATLVYGETSQYHSLHLNILLVYWLHCH